MIRGIKKSRLKGSIALVTVIVVTSVLLVAGIVIVLSSIDLAKATKNIERKAILDGLQRTCLEESMQKVKNQTTYAGTITFTGDNGNCSAQIDDHGSNPDYKVITVDATYEEHVIQEVYTADISQEPPALVR